MAKRELDFIGTAVKSSMGLTLEKYMEGHEKYDHAFDCLRKGKLDEAIHGFVQVLVINPKHVQSYGNLELAFAGLGDRENAIKNLDKAIELDPTYQIAIKNRRNLLILAPGEKLDLSFFSEVEYYKDKVKAFGPGIDLIRECRLVSANQGATPMTDLLKVNTIDQCVALATVDAHDDDEVAMGWQTCLEEVFDGANAELAGQPVNLDGFDTVSGAVLALVRIKRRKLRINLDSLDFVSLKAPQKVWLKAWLKYQEQG